MMRLFLLPVLLVAASIAGWLVRAADTATSGSSTPPLTYELMINGETFSLEANRLVTLKSQLKPGVAYNVAIQIAMEQHVTLDSVQFDYDWPATVHEDRRPAQRMVRIRHELGFSMIVTDLGQPLDAGPQREALKMLADSVAESYRDSGMKKVTVSEPHDRKFGNSSGRGVSIRYQDSQGIAQTSLVYVLTGPRFSASCIAQYFDADAEGVLPKVKKTLDSLRPLTQAADRVDSR